MAELYVYYRVDDPVAAGSKIAALLENMARQTGVIGRKLEKCDEPLLWMEIYQGIDDRMAFAGELASQERQLGIAGLLPPGQPRHQEWFS